MKHVYSLVFFFSTLFSCAVFANSESAHQEIQKTGHDWSVAIAERDPAKITALYDTQAFLFATFANMLDNAADIKEYFVKLTKHKDLKVEFTQEQIRTFGDTAINSGLYVFSFTENGKTVKVPGRYTFVYHKGPNGWKIIDHHSSVLPEK